MYVIKYPYKINNIGWTWEHMAGNCLPGLAAFMPRTVNKKEEFSATNQEKPKKQPSHRVCNPSICWRNISSHSLSLFYGFSEKRDRKKFAGIWGRWRSEMLLHHHQIVVRQNFIKRKLYLVVDVVDDDVVVVIALSSWNN